MKKINIKSCKEDNFKLSMLAITKLMQKKDIRKKFNIIQKEESGRYHYYTDDENYIKFKDFVEFMKKSHKKNKRRNYNNETNEFNIYNLRKQY